VASAQKPQAQTNQPVQNDCFWLLVLLGVAGWYLLLFVTTVFHHAPKLPFSSFVAPPHPLTTHMCSCLQLFGLSLGSHASLLQRLQMLCPQGDLCKMGQAAFAKGGCKV